MNHVDGPGLGPPIMVFTLPTRPEYLIATETIGVLAVKVVGFKGMEDLDSDAFVWPMT